MVSNESNGAVLMKLTAMYTRTATEAVTKVALGMAIAQYLALVGKASVEERLVCFLLQQTDDQQ